MKAIVTLIMVIAVTGIFTAVSAEKSRLPNEEPLIPSLVWLGKEMFCSKRPTLADRAENIIQYNKTWLALKNEHLQGKVATGSELGEAMQKKLEPILEKAGLTVADYGTYPDFNGLQPSQPTFRTIN